MSGGVGPIGDITLPNSPPQPPQQPPHQHPHDSSPPIQNLTLKPPIKSTSTILSFRQLNTLAIMIILSFTGMVSLNDFALVIFSLFYLFFLSKFSFPTPLSDPSFQQPVFNQRSKILNLYILFAAIIGLFLPILYIFEGVFEGDKDGVKACVPHVFLLASQVFMEGVSVSGRFSLPIRVFVPVFYNSTRMFSLVEWFKYEMLHKVVGRDGGSLRRLYVGRSLAVANLGLWGFNLFGFLIPVYLPRAFKRYYTGNGSVVKKD